MPTSPLSPGEQLERDRRRAEQLERDLRRTRWVLLLGGATGGGALLLFPLALGLQGALPLLGALGAGALLAGAAALVGALLGFLFGIPRTLQADPSHPEEGRSTVNTNLEQISDWLT